LSASDTPLHGTDSSPGAWLGRAAAMLVLLTFAAFFIVITIPQARFVDYLIERGARRRAGG